MPESAEVTKFAFEPADMQLLELSHKEYTVPMLNIFKEINESMIGKGSHNENRA